MKKLTRLKPSTKILNDFYVFDTETGVRKKNGDIQWVLRGRPENFIFGVVYGYNFTKVIHNRKEFIEEFKSPRYKNKKVFAHNAEYDLDVLYGDIFELDREAIFNGKFISASNGNCQFADSLNIYRTKAAVIGEMLGIKKQKLGNSGKKLVSKGGVSAKDINYCIRDCEIIWQALFQIFEEVGSIKITQASLSMDYYRRFFQPFDIEHNENTLHFFDSYFGGRCEAFRIGKVKGKVRDVNSMYPFGMRNAIFPNPKYLKVVENVPVNKFLKSYLNRYEGMVYCEVDHKETWIGYLPVKKGGKLLFPVGSFAGCWNFNELRFAIESNVVTIRKITKVVYSEPMESPFINYVDTLYRKRFETDNDFQIYRIKIFMNSLYGKFAQQILENYVYIKDMEKDIDSIIRYQREGIFIKLVPFSETRRDAFLVTKNSKEFTINYSIPSFASYITSYCRVFLLKSLLKTGKKNLLYCDTDSQFFEGVNNWKDEKQLGGWKLEDKIITGVYGLKNYTYIDKKGNKKRRLKGVPESAKEITKNNFRYVNLVKTKEGLRRGLEPGTQIDRSKEIKGTYTKRVVLKSGETKPIKLTL